MSKQVILVGPLKSHVTLTRKFKLGDNSASQIVSDKEAEYYSKLPYFKVIDIDNPVAAKSVAEEIEEDEDIDDNEENQDSDEQEDSNDENENSDENSAEEVKEESATPKKKNKKKNRK